MRSETDRVAGALQDILHNIDLAVEFVSGLNAEQLQNDTRSFYATVRCLEIISEASRRLPDPIKARHAEIRWRDIAAAGNYYRHEYDGILPLDIFNTVLNRFPELREVALLEHARIIRPAFD